MLSVGLVIIAVNFPRHYVLCECDVGLESKVLDQEVGRYLLEPQHLFLNRASNSREDI